MTNTYAKAYTEVLEILSHFSKEEYDKIPEEKINFYKNNMDKDYIYNINPEVDLSEQEVSKEANAILVSLFRDYFATEKQKQTLKNLLNQNQEKIQKAKREKYNAENIFKNKKIDSDIEILNETKDNMQISKYKEQKWYQKILGKISKVLRKN